MLLSYEVTSGADAYKEVVSQKIRGEKQVPSSRRREQIQAWKILFENELVRDEGVQLCGMQHLVS